MGQGVGGIQQLAASQAATAWRSCLASRAPLNAAFCDRNQWTQTEPSWVLCRAVSFRGILLLLKRRSMSAIVDSVSWRIACSAPAHDHSNEFWDRFGVGACLLDARLRLRRRDGSASNGD